MKYLRLSGSLLLGLTLAGSGCGSADEPTAKPTIDLVASNSFELTLRDTTTAEAVIAAIVEAGRDQLATACEAYPGGSVRIFNPLASGRYEDIACSTILDVEESVGQSQKALTCGEEHIGQVQQKGIISTVACFAGGTAAFLGTRYGICPHGRTEQDRTNCNDVGGWGGVGLGFVCGFTLLFPF
jgi:hypothetical protein